MKTLNSVKTRAKAVELLEAWLADQLTPETGSLNTYIADTEGYCECGETHVVRASIEGFDKMAFIAVCEACGDDDAIDALTIE